MIAPVGTPIPDISHAVSVSLPLWQDNVDYEEGRARVVSKMKTGYPRFFIHLIIQDLEREILKRHGRSDEKVMLFPSTRTAEMCANFIDSHSKSARPGRLVFLEADEQLQQRLEGVVIKLSCVFFAAQDFSIAKQVWQHSGAGISSRRGEFCLKALRAGQLVEVQKSRCIPKDDSFHKGPRRYQRGMSQNNIDSQINGHSNGVHSQSAREGSELQDFNQFVEERFARNLNQRYGQAAKRAVRRRIAGTLKTNTDIEHALDESDHVQENAVINKSPSIDNDRFVAENDVYLYPCGMNAIFNAHQACMEARRGHKNICFGFPYIDTLKTLEKWGPGCRFFGNGTDEDLDDLEVSLKAGDQFAALFTEFPSNPLLRAPNLTRIRELADRYDFLIVVDETVGNYINTDVLSRADIVVSSLTKIFSGDSNVMGGSLVLNSAGKHYHELKEILHKQFEDNYWVEDAIYMERNSRDFVSRIDRINHNAEVIADVLNTSKLTKQVYYPKLNPSKPYYDARKTRNGGYGGLLSVTFDSQRDSQIFFDSLKIAKGPSLGTNFTLASPYTLLAHYTELEWVKEFGVDPYLVRISVGLEDSEELKKICEDALADVAKGREAT